MHLENEINIQMKLILLELHTRIYANSRRCNYLVHEALNCTYYLIYWSQMVAFFLFRLSILFLFFIVSTRSFIVVVVHHDDSKWKKKPIQELHHQTDTFTTIDSISTWSEKGRKTPNMSRCICSHCSSPIQKQRTDSPMAIYNPSQRSHGSKCNRYDHCWIVRLMCLCDVLIFVSIVHKRHMEKKKRNNI